MIIKIKKILAIIIISLAIEKKERKEVMLIHLLRHDLFIYYFDIFDLYINLSFFM